MLQFMTFQFHFDDFGNDIGSLRDMTATVFMLVCSCRPGSLRLPKRCCEAGGGVRGLPGVAETTGCGHQPLHRGRVRVAATAGFHLSFFCGSMPATT